MQENRKRRISVKKKIGNQKKQEIKKQRKSEKNEIRKGDLKKLTNQRINK